jgi:hypothetical protein
MRAGGVVLHCKNSSEIEFPQTNYTPLLPKGAVTLPTPECWFRLTSDINDGFDALYVNKEAKMARLLQFAEKPETVPTSSVGLKTMCSDAL